MIDLLTNQGNIAELGWLISVLAVFYLKYRQECYRTEQLKQVNVLEEIRKEQLRQIYTNMRADPLNIFGSILLKSRKRTCSFCGSVWISNKCPNCGAPNA